MEEKQINVSKNDEDNKLILRIQKIYEGWLSIRAKVEEIMEPVLFFGGGTLTALIALGILPWGALGIGICATLTFIGISRFVLTNSWTAYHNVRLARDCNCHCDCQGFVRRHKLKHFKLKRFVISIILAVAGVALGVLGVTGVLGLGLALGIGIPSLVLGGMDITACWIFRPIFNQKTSINISDNFWGLCMLIAGLASVATFFALGLTGVLALPTAIALGAPGLALAAVITLIFVGTRIGFWVKNKQQEVNTPINQEKYNIEKQNIQSCSFIGLSWAPNSEISEQNKEL